MYSCQNCRWMNHFPSYNYYEPDDYECNIPSDLQPSFECKDEDERISRCWSNGENWSDPYDPICPYYEYDYYKDF